MSQQTIDIGATPNDGTGDPLRDAFDKCNDNFSELYAAIAAAEGDAKAMTLRATAEAEANNKIAASLTSPILRKLAIEKFNPNVKLVVPNNAFVNFANGEITGDK